jgi:preprotein translocase subunit YajC
VNNAVGNLLFIVVLFGIFYVLLIRPQKKRAQEHNQLVTSIDVGDEIVTIGGLYGKVVAIGDDYMELESSPGVRLRYTKTAIHHRVNEKLRAPTAAKAEPTKPAELPAATAAAKKTTARTSPAKKTTAKRTTAKKTTAKKSTAKKATRRKSTAKKTTIRS